MFTIHPYRVGASVDDGGSGNSGDRVEVCNIAIACMHHVVLEEVIRAKIQSLPCNCYDLVYELDLFAVLLSCKFPFSILSHGC